MSHPFKEVSLCLCCRIAKETVCSPGHKSSFPQVAVDGQVITIVLILSTLADATLTSGVVSSGVAESDKVVAMRCKDRVLWVLLAILVFLWWLVLHPRVASPLDITMPGSSVIRPRGLHISGHSISGRGRALLPLPPPVITHTIGFGQGRGGRGGPWYGGRGGERGRSRSRSQGGQGQGRGQEGQGRGQGG